MTTFPSIPDWDGIHPAIVQFPIALLGAASLLLLVSLFAPRSWSTWSRAALLLMAVGTFAAWLGVASGHAAGQLVDKNPLLERAIAAHEALGMKARNLFTVLTLVFAVILLVPAMIRRPLPAAARNTLHALFLVVYLSSTVVIAHTASQGGRLVHELNVRAIVEKPEPRGAMAGGQTSTPDAPAGPRGSSTSDGAR